MLRSTLLGSTKEEFKEYQREEVKWRELTECLEGWLVPSKHYHKATLDQFVMMERIYFPSAFQ